MKKPRSPSFRASFCCAFDRADLIIDCFAGGGGASVGIEAALGRSPDIAINHDPEAIAMHSANHPNTKHYIEDIWAVDPREACGSRKVGLAWFSPSCVHFSKAKGSKPLDKKIRGLAWTVVRWIVAVQPRVIVVENVEEFEDWGPLGSDHRPIPEKLGQTFRAWVSRIRNLGYEVDWRELVAADYGAPTTRKRLFLVARCDGQPIVWPEPTHGKGRANPWRAAYEIIDWSLPTRSIFGREKPLAEATMRRIATGLRRYVFESKDPFIIPLTHQGADRVYDIREPLRTVTAAHRGEFALVGPTLITKSWGERKGQAPRVPGLEKPLGTIMAEGAKHELVLPFLAKAFGGATGHSTPGIPVTGPLSTITAQDHHYLTAAWFTKFYGTSIGSGMELPMPTITANGKGGGHIAEIRAFLIKYYGAGGAAQGQDVRDPLHTITAKARFGLVTIHGVDYELADVGMRMLAAHELFAAQDFPRGYDISPDFNGKPLTKTAQTRLAGNSVSPPPARRIIEANTRMAA